MGASLDDLTPSADALAASVYFRPEALISGRAAAAEIAAGRARPLAGGPLAFRALAVRVRGRGEALADLAEAARWADRQGIDLDSRLDRLSAPRPPLAGLSLDRPRIMAVVNVTPDSFSDGGRFLAPDAAIAHGRDLVAAGADLLDIGGESTRPGADPVTPADEQARVLPVIAGLAGAGVPVSIDSRHAATMTAAVAAGAGVINDVTALAGDPDSPAAAAAAGVPVVLMHTGGDPRTMQDDPRYDDVLLDVFDHLAARIDACGATGIPRDRILVDPGIGFGKTVAHNLALLRGLALFHGLGCPVLLGVSRKSFIARLSAGEPADRRLAGSLTAALAGLDRGAQILRVHDVAETAQAVAVWRGLGGATD